MRKREWPVVLAAAFAAAAVAPAHANTALATNPGGSQVILFQPQQQPARSLFAAARSPGGRFRTLKAIAPGSGIFDMRAAVDNAGGVVAAWNSQDPPAGRPDQVFASIRPPGGTFAAPTKLLEGPPEQGFGFAANGAGDAIAAHTGDTFRGSGDLYAFRPRGAGFEPTQTFPPSVAPVCSNDLSTDPDGTAHCFSQSVGMQGGVDVYEFVCAPSGAFGPPTRAAHLHGPDGACRHAAPAAEGRIERPRGRSGRMGGRRPFGASDLPRRARETLRQASRACWCATVSARLRMAERRDDELRSRNSCVGAGDGETITLVARDFRATRPRPRQIVGTLAPSTARLR